MKYYLYLSLLLAIGKNQLLAQNNLILNTKTHNADTIVTLIPDCWGKFPKIKKKINRPLTIVQKDSCDWMHGWAGVKPTNQQEFIMQYDTLRHYIESCGKNDDSYDVFGALDGAVQGYAPNDTTRYDRYRDWLISVLYINTTQPFYFCNCMQSIAGTYYYGKYALPNAPLTVINYLRTIPSCDDKGLEQEWSLSIENRHKAWLNSQHLIGSDTSIKEDTTLPSLDKIGLGFLLNNTVKPYTTLPTIYLASFTSTPNPFKAETTLSFELNRMAYVTVEVFDPLGRKVWGDDHGYSLDKGIHTVHLDGAKLSSGSYYARISTGFGEVKTVKIIKE